MEEHIAAYRVETLVFRHHHILSVMGIVGIMDAFEGSNHFGFDRMPGKLLQSIGNAE